LATLAALDFQVDPPFRARVTTPCLVVRGTAARGVGSVLASQRRGRLSQPAARATWERGHQSLQTHTRTKCAAKSGPTRFAMVGADGAIVALGRGPGGGCQPVPMGRRWWRGTDPGRGQGTRPALSVGSATGIDSGTWLVAAGGGAGRCEEEGKSTGGASKQALQAIFSLAPALSPRRRKGTGSISRDGGGSCWRQPAGPRWGRGDWACRSCPVRGFCAGRTSAAWHSRVNAKDRSGPFTRGRGT